ncbi:MAG: hypothetical protein MRZ61_05520 [Oscillospiraceae bacterium]|nr:hypothetical protein [Oscillospiraceae bacterium]
MRANFKKHSFCTDNQVQQYIDKEWNKRVEQVFESCKRDIIAQLMSVCCMALSVQFGFGRERLNRFKKSVEEMLKFEAFGKKSNTQNCIDLMRDKYGIDFDSKEGENADGKEQA